MLGPIGLMRPRTCSFAISIWCCDPGELGLTGSFLGLRREAGDTLAAQTRDAEKGKPAMLRIDVQVLLRRLQQNSVGANLSCREWVQVRRVGPQIALHRGDRRLCRGCKSALDANRTVVR